MRHKLESAIPLLIFTIASCGAVPEANGTQESASCELAQCGRLVYSDVRVAPESGDLTGVELELIHDPLGIWRGVVTFAEGEMGLPYRVKALSFDPGTGELSFTVSVDGTNDLQFAGMATCEQVVGEAQVYAGAEPVPWTLGRLQLCEGQEH